MTVGEYAGVPLQNPGDTWRNGAVFLLRKPAGASESVALDGWVTSVVRGAKVAVTCGPTTAASRDETFAEALNAANRALDYMSVRGQAHCVISDAPDDSLVWWPDASVGGVVMRCRAVQSYGMTVSATGVVRDADGSIRPSPPPPTPLADDVFRFVRICRTSDDLYDAYRNLFLGFECLLSDIRPRRQVPIPQRRCSWWWPTRPHNSATKWESENDWFMDALDQAHQLVPLDRLTPPDVMNHKKWINRWMYSAERSALMHAKRGQNYLLPHDASSRAELTESLGRLWEYMMNLIEAHFDVRGRRGSLSRHAVEKAATSVLSQIALVVSDDNSEQPVNPEAENVISPDATVVELQSSKPVVDPDDPELWTMLAYREAADLAGLAAIRRFGQTRPDGSGRCDVLSEFVGPLILGSTVVRLEMLYGLRHINPTGPPRVFSS
ncbi:hypothetical protein [Mycobacterium sp. 852002-51152_SCH6134967]|uniref:hypothetical protein n=1 Tax=Mycobacterium sp. 852002-51152_SCH6134967 TaxID=1834096 RepID=UPI0009EEB6B4|nr:hypothetical protein [Mycobacterium sp. 852002-51152_SCH6134967]